MNKERARRAKRMPWKEGASRSEDLCLEAWNTRICMDGMKMNDTITSET
jgi:hypothetical protein